MSSIGSGLKFGQGLQAELVGFKVASVLVYL